jgi:dTDP-glucose 4,6-dehydratase
MDSHYKGKKILITGGSGFIGSFLTQSLIAEGADVSVFLRYKSKKTLNQLNELNFKEIDKIKFFYGDLRNYESLSSVFKDIDIVFHLASITSVPYSFLQPKDVFDNNISSTVNVLAAVKKFKTDRVVIVSTAAVYGSAKYFPIDEKHQLNPHSPYAASKVASDEIALSYYYSFQSPIVILRLFNTFGPRQTMRAIIPNVVVQAIKGDSIKIGRTDSIRDFNYISNAINGILLAGSKAGIEGEIINIGSGEICSIDEIINLTGEILGKKLKKISELIRVRPLNSDIDKLHASTKKAEELLGYTSDIGFKEGLIKTIDYYKQRYKNYYSEEYEI